jgi:hypothetical protein
MPMGFVYVLINPANPGLVKIGLTVNTSEERSSELYATGVPKKFQVVYDELVSDCSLVEMLMHQRFDKYRCTKGREFFEIPIKIAVKALIEIARPFLVPDATLKTRCEILPKLRAKFRRCIRRSLTSVAVIHLPDLYIIEFRHRPTKGHHDQLLERVDLEFISGIETSFPNGTDVRENASDFVKQLSLAKLLVISESLLSDEGRQRAIEDYNSGLPPELLAVELKPAPPSTPR